MKDFMLFICVAPPGTTGDIVSCVRAIDTIRVEAPGLDIKMLTSTESKHVENIDKIIPHGIENRYLFRDPARDPSMDRLTNAFEKDPQLKDIFENASSFVIYPVGHLLTESDYDWLKQFSKPIIFMSKYNLDLSYEKSHKWSTYPPLRSCFIETGFEVESEKNLGVYIPEQDATGSLVNIEDQDIALRDFLLGKLDLAQREKQYFEDHKLYFGYYNVAFVNAEIGLSREKSFVKHFIETCIQKAARQSPDKKIDIVLPLPFKNNSLFDFRLFLSIHKELNLSGYTIEYWGKTKNGLEKQAVCGRGKQLMRIINPFSLQKRTFDILLKISDPFSLVTGDMSLTEAISSRKLFLYQTMAWQKIVIRKMIASVELYCGVDSKLRDFFMMQMRPELTSTAMATYLIDHEAILLEEMEIFASRLSKEQNIKDRLPKALSQLLHSEQEREIVALNFAKNNVQWLIDGMNRTLNRIGDRDADNFIQSLKFYRSILLENQYDLFGAIQKIRSPSISILEFLLNGGYPLSPEGIQYCKEAWVVGKLNETLKSKRISDVSPHFYIRYCQNQTIRIEPGAYDICADESAWHTLEPQREAIYEFLTSQGFNIDRVSFYNTPIEKTASYFSSESLEIQINFEDVHTKEQELYLPMYAESSSKVVLSQPVSPSTSQKHRSGSI